MTGPSSTGDKIERAAGMVIVVIVGSAFLAAGLFGFIYEIRHQRVDKWIIGPSVGLAILGALMLPSVFAISFPRVKQIFVLVFPNGLPIIGGRRAGDPPKGGGE